MTKSPSYEPRCQLSTVNCQLFNTFNDRLKSSQCAQANMRKLSEFRTIAKANLLK